MAPDGLRVDLRVGDPGHCEVADAAAAADGRAENVARTVDDGTTITEFTVVGDEVGRESLETVFEDDDVTRFRHRADGDSFCACEVLSEHGCPVSNVTADDGSLSFSFFTTDLDTLESVIDVLRERFDDVTVRELARNQDLAGRDPVTVDRAHLTDRQREVLETALEMGYFETPKRANASEVADDLGLALSTVSEHLAAAQRKVFSMALDADRDCRS